MQKGTEELRQANLSLEAKGLEELQKEVLTLQAQERQNARSDVKTQQMVGNVANQAAGRTVTPDEIKKLGKLRGKGRSITVVISDDIEQRSYGNDLMAALQKIGFEAKTAESHRTSAYADLIVCGTSADDAKLFKAFKNAGIPAKFLNHRNDSQDCGDFPPYPYDGTRIVIGQRPLG